MKKGFTLIELLAVIVILAIIATITVPVVVNLITSSRNNALVDTGYSLVRSAQNYQLILQSNSKSMAFTVIFPSGEVSNGGSLEIKNDLHDAGFLSSDSSGNISLAIWSDKARRCALKKSNSKEVIIDESIKTSSDCVGTSV